MATKATSITKTETVTKTVMVPTTVTEEVKKDVPVVMFKANFRNREAFDPAKDIAALGNLLQTMKTNGVSFTIRVKAVKVMENATASDKTALAKLNNLLIRQGKEANVPARKDSPDTPTASCNSCSDCTKS